VSDGGAAFAAAAQLIRRDPAEKPFTNSPLELLVAR
jgi:hypothetical protein